MQSFSILFAGLGVLAALIYFFSLWTTFGVVYMLGILFVVVIAFFRRSNGPPVWKQESATDEQAAR